ncbi:MAG: hypothetical protein IPJ82_12590 [Lewinellaceae bacterium]|nr:hypothetical protein [Lewinellaceae bacterium]
MKKPRIILCRIVLYLLPGLLFAQNADTMFTGEYYLQGVMEVASGFRFNADSTFDFYFSYGAMDRVGKGTFERRGDSLILQSASKPERDFILKTEKKTDDPTVIIQVTDPNAMVLSHVLCALETPDSVFEAQSDREGYVVFDKTPVKTIFLMHEFWPDRPSVFPIADAGSNYFLFTIDPRIVEVDFNGAVLHLAGNTLEGPHPLLKAGRAYRFTKQ